MASLYGRLFKYRARRSRRPKEDFLTEALADLLSRMPSDKSQEFIVNLLIPKSEAAKQEWSKAANGKFSWHTQKPIKHGNRSGRLDLTLDGPTEETLLIVENKVGSPVGWRTPPDSGTAAQAGAVMDADADNAAADRLHQLGFYSAWLAEKRSGQTWRGAICLLTHGTRAPAEFCIQHEPEGAELWRHVCHWSEVWRWIEKEARPLPGVLRDPWQVFAHDLAEYLKEEGMNSEQFSTYDISAGNIFVKSSGKFKNSFNVIWESIESRTLRNIPNGVLRESVFREPFALNSDGGVIWDWIYLYPPFSKEARKNWFIAWGLRFPELSSWWNDCNPRLPTDTHAFVTWGADGNPPVPALLPAELPDGWSMSADGIVIAKALHRFEAGPHGLATALGEWIAAQIQELLPFIQRYVTPDPNVQS